MQQELFSYIVRKILHDWQVIMFKERHAFPNYIEARTFADNLDAKGYIDADRLAA